MKRVTLKSPVSLNVRDGKGGVERFVFKPSQAYEVSDTVASYPYLQSLLASCEEVEEVKVKKTVRRKKKVVEDDNNAVAD